MTADVPVSAPQTIEERINDLAVDDHPGAVWVAILMARKVLGMAPAWYGDAPAHALLMAEKWLYKPYLHHIQLAGEAAEACATVALGQPELYAVEAARAAARAASSDADRTAPLYAFDYAVQALTEYDVLSKSVLYDIEGRGHTFTRSARIRFRGSAYDKHHAECAAQVLAQMTPLTLTTEQRLTAAPVVQVALDSVEQRYRTVELPDGRKVQQPVGYRVGTLGDAVRRAHRLGLDWNKPAQRALAERTRDAITVGRILDAARDEVPR